MDVYGGYSIEPNDLSFSSSGGLFVTIAKYILSIGGVVYGVSMSDSCYFVEYIRVDNLNDLYKLQGSKYVQVKMDDTYNNVKEDLNNNRIVLFSGVGCQINGLKSFLGKEYDLLYCVDMICHGVPSAKLWMKYLEYIEEKKGKVHSVNFRCKVNGWENYGISKNEDFISKEDDIYLQFFLKDICLRPSCYKCIAKLEKRSDITLADFWGVNNIDPSIYNHNGTSLVIVRTNKGKEIFLNIKDKIVYKNEKYSEVIKFNKSEYKSAYKPRERKIFYSDLDKMSFESLAKLYLTDSILYKIIRYLKVVMKGNHQ